MASDWETGKYADKRFTHASPHITSGMGESLQSMKPLWGMLFGIVVRD